MPHEKKLNFRTVSYFFVGYSERSRCFRLYCSSTKNIIEIDDANFIEDIQNSKNKSHKNFTFEKDQIVILMVTVPNDEVIVSLQHKNTVVPLQGTYTVYSEEDPVNEVELENLQSQVPKRSARERRSAIANDYIVYLQEHEVDIRWKDGPHP